MTIGWAQIAGWTQMHWPGTDAGACRRRARTICRYFALHPGHYRHIATIQSRKKLHFRTKTRQVCEV